MGEGGGGRNKNKKPRNGPRGEDDSTPLSFCFQLQESASAPLRFDYAGRLKGTRVRLDMSVFWWVHGFRARLPIPVVGPS